MTVSDESIHRIQIELWPIDRLVPYERNARTHSAEQVQKIAESMMEFGFTNPILVDESDGIIAGHGRLMAAKSLGLKQVPVIPLTYLTPMQKRAYIIADNRLALDAGWDIALLNEELIALESEDFDLAATGFTAEEIADIYTAAARGDNDVENFVRVIEAPIYEVTGKRPSMSELMDRSKCESLRSEILRADVPEEVRAFLLHAAERHTAFDFRMVAEFYADTDATTQRLMERSALVIVDEGGEVEQGFVKLSKALMDMVGPNNG